MQIDLLLTTQNRHGPMRRLLESLCRQRTKAFRLVAGVQDADPEMLQLLEEYAAKIALKTVPLPLCGLSHARNCLLPHIRSAYFALTDDDCAYPPDTLADVLNFFASHPTADACVGRPLPLACASGTAVAPVASPSLRTEPSLFPACKPSRMTRYSVFYNAPSYVIFFRRSVIERVGPFDEELGLGASSPWQCGEETDYLLRLLACGGNVMRTPHLAVFHPAADGSAAPASKWYAYGRGRMHLLRKYRMPLWFRLAHIAHPLFRLLQKPNARRSPLRHLLKGRLDGFFHP